MTELIRNQGMDLFYMFYAGLAIMLVMETKYMCQHKFNISKWFTIFSDIGTWILVAFLVSGFLYYCDYGKITWHSSMALLIGVVVWKKFFYGIIDKGSEDAKEKRKDS